jgi:hypothetical protein
VVRRKAVAVNLGNLQRSTSWAGVREGDPVIVNADKEKRLKWVFVAHVQNKVTNEEWIEVRGGRPGEQKLRSFRCELIFPGTAKKGSRVTGLSLRDAPQLSLE